MEGPLKNSRHERFAYDFLRHYHAHFKRKVKAVLDAK